MVTVSARVHDKRVIAGQEVLSIAADAQFVLTDDVAQSVIEVLQPLLGLGERCQLSPLLLGKPSLFAELLVRSSVGLEGESFCVRDTGNLVSVGVQPDETKTVSVCLEVPQDIVFRWPPSTEILARKLLQVEVFIALDFVHQGRILTGGNAGGILLRHAGVCREEDAL